MLADQVLEQYAIATRVGHLEIAGAPGAVERVLVAVQSTNKMGRLPELADELNPIVLDEEKVKSFFLSLPGQPPATLEKLRGRTLSLNDSSLRLHAWSPVVAATLAQGSTILLVDDPSKGEDATAIIDASMDAKLARERANRAKQAMLDADRKADVLDKEKRAPRASSAAFVTHATAERRRYAAATVWRELVSVLSQRHPDDLALKRELAHAEELASKYLVAPWTGMP